jgi:hypothetical protein
MITYKLNQDGSYALKIVEGISTGEWHSVESNQEYLKWVAEGNLPSPADIVEPSQASVTPLPADEV